MKHLYFNIYLFILLFTPVLFVTNTGELFEFPKTFFIYISALIVLLLYVIELLLNFQRPKKPSLPILFYIATFILTTVTSIHLYTSVWGYYTRFNDGLLSVLAYFVLYFVAKQKFDSVDFSRLNLALLLPIIPVALYGIFQHFGFLDGKVIFGERTDRVYSTFGQPNWLAQYLVLMLPLVLFKVFDNVKSWFWYVMFLLGFSCLWFTFSLSGFAGFAAVFSLSVYYLYKKHSFMLIRLKLLSLVLFMLLVMMLFPGILKSRIHDLKQDVFGHLVIRLSAQTANTPTDPSRYRLSDAGYIRKAAWGGTWNLIISSPKVFLLGTGPETYPYSFQPFRPVALNYSSEWSYLFNKPHNYYLEIWSESGVLGIIAYAILYFYLFSKQTIDKRISLVGFAITNIFGWPVVATTLVFWMWLADAELAEEAAAYE